MILFNCDGYKLSHMHQYPQGTQYICSNLTARKSRIKDVNEVVVFGISKFVQDLHEEARKFFMGNIDEIVREYVDTISKYMNVSRENVHTDHIKALHKLGYLPVRIMGMPEGSSVKIGDPILVIHNTHPDFFWLTNYLETWMSNSLWGPITSATTAKRYRTILDKYAKETSSTPDFVDWQGHDFSMRGMWGNEAAAMSGAAHLIYFHGTDTIPAVKWIEKYYGDTPVAGSVPASEHSVMSVGSHVYQDNQSLRDGELNLYKKLITETYPNGIVSLVSDTYDYWQVLTDFMPRLKNDILSRNGKVVIRPDCLDDQSQILTPNGWKFFNDLTSDDLVAQVKRDNTYEFVKPIKIINQQYSGDMYHIRDFHGKIDLMVTPNHRIVSYREDGSISIKEASEYKQNYYGFRKLRSPKSQNTLKELSFHQRLLIALQADGTVRDTKVDGSIRIEFNFTKERKHKRLLEILKNLDYEYTFYYPKSRKGQSTFSIIIPNSIPVSKTFDWVDISNLDAFWCEQFIEELKHWDSSVRNSGRFKYDTTVKENAEIVEYIAIAAGKGVLLSESEDSRKPHFSNVYTCHIMDDPYIGGQAITVEKTTYSGTVHCVQVPTGLILVKRNRGVCVTGNSGDPVDVICGYPFIVIDDENIKDDEEDNVNDILKEIARDSIDLDHDESGYFDGTEYLRYKDRFIKYEYTGYWSSWNGTDFYSQKLTDLEGEELAITKGSIETLWEIFGGTVNDKGFKELDSHIGLIYGDSITVERAEEICARLKKKGFASTNVVLGIGSYTYTYCTRDTLGSAVKATYAIVNGVGYPIYKEPKGDSSKKSHKGVPIQWEDGVTDGHSIADLDKPSRYRTYYVEGAMPWETSFADVVFKARHENA